MIINCDGLCEPRKETMELSETDKAWMAGFVDGEGCITISKQVRKNRPSPAYRVSITIANSDRRVLDFFLVNYGGAIYHVHERRRDKHSVKWADAFDWHCPISSSEQFLLDILPYLRIKYQQATYCLEFLRTRVNTKQSRRANGTFAGSEGLTAAELEKREFFHTVVRQLNSKGPSGRKSLGGST